MVVIEEYQESEPSTPPLMESRIKRDESKPSDDDSGLDPRSEALESTGSEAGLKEGISKENGSCLNATSLADRSTDAGIANTEQAESEPPLSEQSRAGAQEPETAAAEGSRQQGGDSQNSAEIRIEDGIPPLESQDIPPEGRAQECADGEDEVFEDALSEEDLRKRAIAEAEEVKAEGNALYAKKDFCGALAKYSQALELLPDHEDAKEPRATYYSNSAICHLQLGEHAQAVTASSAAIELKPDYVKALLRRAQAQEQLDHLDEALADLKKVVEVDPGNKAAMASILRLEPIAAEKREKLKEEMLGKLKDLGNSLLGHFGMSMDNFKAVKDPETGSYSINFQQ